MKLKNIVVMALKGADSQLRTKLMVALGITSLNTYYKYLNTNDSNLTKAAALQVIREELNLTEEELLEVESMRA